jgi:hypothetical protein
MKNNFVAKHMNKYNTSKVYADKKALDKKGYKKHKKSVANLNMI